MGRNLGSDPDSDPDSDVDLTLTSMLMHNDINGGDWNRKRIEYKTGNRKGSWNGRRGSEKGNSKREGRNSGNRKDWGMGG